MSAETFKIVEVNPNDAVGGGGCACSESKVTDCTGPYAVFYAQEQASNLSPHLVVGCKCLAAAALAADGEAVAGGEVGEDTVIDAEVVAEEDVPEV